MSERVTGTFEATGQSATITANRLAIDLNFGTGTVVVQWRLDGENWTDVESFTADAAKLYGPGPTVEWRLNCTDHSVDIVYSMVN